jgi:hypothetical protein
MTCRDTLGVHFRCPITMNAINDSASPKAKFDNWPVWLVSAAAGVVATKLGWDFGNELSGPLVGVVAAANFGVIAALLVGTGADRLWSLLRRR